MGGNYWSLKNAAASGVIVLAATTGGRANAATPDNNHQAPSISVSVIDANSGSVAQFDGKTNIITVQSSDSGSHYAVLDEKNGKLSVADLNRSSADHSPDPIARTQATREIAAAKEAVASFCDGGTAPVEYWHDGTLVSKGTITTNAAYGDLRPASPEGKICGAWKNGFAPAP